MAWEALEAAPEYTALRDKVTGLTADGGPIGEKIGSDCMEYAGFDCPTPYGPGACCAANGLTLWESEEELLGNLTEAGQAVTPGDLVYLSGSIFMELPVGAGGAPTPTNMKLGYYLPTFIPDPCMDEDDAAFLWAVSSAGCQASSPEILQCSIFW